MSLAKGAFSLFTRDFLLMISSTVTSILIARKLGPEVMGIWVLISLIPIYAETFGRLKFDIAAIYFLGKGDYQEKDVERTLNAVAIIISAIICLSCLLLSEQICSYLFDGSLAHLNLLRVCLLQIPFTFLYMNYTYLLIYKENLTVYNTMVVIRALAGSFGGLLLLYVFDSGLVGVVAMSVLAVVVSFVFGFFHYKSNDKSKYKLLNLDMVNDFASYSSRLYLAGIIGNLNVYALRTLLVSFLDPSRVAFFSIAQDRAVILNKIPESLNVLLFAKMAKTDTDQERINLLVKSFRLVSLVMCIAGMISVIAIYPFVYLLYGSAYLPVVVPFMLLVPGIIASGSISVLVQYFNGIGKPNIQLWIYGIILVSQVILIFTLNHRMSLVLAAITFSASMFLAVFFAIRKFMKVAGISFTEILIKKEDCIFLFSFVGEKIKVTFGSVYKGS